MTMPVMRMIIPYMGMIMPYMSDYALHGYDYN